MLTEKDLAVLKKRGITPEDVKYQLDSFKKGYPFSRLIRSASKGDGIMVFEVKKIDELLDRYNEKIQGLRIVKFVPASGAASRMFKQLSEFRGVYDKDKNQEELWVKKDINSMWYFFEHIRDFAFFQDLKEKMNRQGLDVEEELKHRNYNVILEALLQDSGLGYDALPKALLAFHKYVTEVRTAMEEHLVEGAGYADVEGLVRLHFTVSPEHIEKFKQRIALVLSKYEERFKTTYDISYSIQKPSTDTIAVTLDNELFRTEAGDLLFRPGGHGALIENLNDLDADMVFIKNIDNVTTDKNRIPTITYKKVIASYLIELQKNIFDYLKQLEDESVSDLILAEIFHFAWRDLSIAFDHFERLNPNQKRLELIKKLNRPIRICGMVKNEGEPGGGPFWTEDINGDISLQIVESSQIDMQDLQQKDLAGQASHFNPVDLVCGIKNYKGEKFDLHAYIDPQTGFISEKSSGGRKLKALELPGLWNGAMADWITIFVEVPIAIFSPVKTINDLLRREHQNI